MADENTIDELGKCANAKIRISGFAADRNVCATLLSIMQHWMVEGSVQRLQFDFRHLALSVAHRPTDYWLLITTLLGSLKDCTLLNLVIRKGLIFHPKFEFLVALPNRWPAG